MALLASSLVAEVVGTLMLLIVSIPFSLAVFTASLVVALLMSAIASSASFCAWLTNAVFSSVVKIAELLMLAFLAVAASLIAFIASVAFFLTPLSSFQALFSASVSAFTVFRSAYVPLLLLTLPPSTEIILFTAFVALS